MNSKVINNTRSNLSSLFGGFVEVATKKKLFEGSLNILNKKTLVSLNDDLYEYDLIFFIIHEFTTDGSVITFNCLSDTIKGFSSNGIAFSFSAFAAFAVQHSDEKNKVYLTFSNSTGGNAVLREIIGIKF